ncbi:MAG: TonB-dependent receptor [Pseudomonadota bacterium]
MTKPPQTPRRPHRLATTTALAGPLALLLSASGMAGAKEARAQETLQVAQATTEATAEPTTGTYAIAPQPLETALERFSEQTGIAFAYSSDLVAPLRSPGARGALAVEEALRAILAGSGLTYRFLSATSVVLEDDPNSLVAPADGPVLLNELTVTARRFEENLQDVPGSVAVLDAAELEKSNVEDLRDYTQRLPNINFLGGSSPGDSIVSIRGFSDLSAGASSGPVNGVYVDEVILNPNGTTSGIDPNLFDLERVEVAYGPQGTTFGRGTIGGAINLVTKKPTEAFEASAELLAGSYPNGRGRIVANGSLTGDRRLMARFVAFGEISDGFIDSPNLEANALGTSDYGARLSLRSEPTDRLTLDASASFDRSNYNQFNSAASDSIESGAFFNNAGSEGDSQLDRALFTLRGEYDIGLGSLISNTSFLRVTVDQNNDFDLELAEVGVTNGDTTETSIAQEFRFESDAIDLPYAGETFFTLGANISFSSVEVSSAVNGGPDLAFPGVPITGGALTNDTDQDVFNLGLFGDLRFRPTDRLELGAGVRFSRDRVRQSFENDATGLFRAIGGSSFELDDEATFSAVTPRGSIKYDWTESLSTFLSVATGYRPGGFNIDDAATVNPTFEEESAITIDAGFKSSWFDGRLVVNGTGFATFYDDIQIFTGIETPDGGAITALDNAAEARSIGAEIGIRAQPIDGLTIALDYGLAKTKFIEFVGSTGVDFSGTTLPNAPTHTLGMAVEYAHPVLDESADAFVRVEHSFTSSFVNGATVNTFEFDSRNVVNLRLGLRAERWEVELFTENLFDEVYANGTTAAASARILGVGLPLDPGPSRQVGVRARVLF